MLKVRSTNQKQVQLIVYEQTLDLWNKYELRENKKLDKKNWYL